MSIETLLSEQKESLEHFFNLVDKKKIELILKKLLACKGAVILSGVGKSGYIAEKVSKTLLSTGTHSFFLSSQEALHGDIALVSEEDVCLLFSKSGETKELLDIVPFLKKRKAFVISAVSDIESSLAKTSDLAIALPIKRELCPYNLAPTTSTLLQLMLGDVLAVGLMKAKKFSVEDYSQNHPLGNIGKRSTLKVKDLMLTEDALPLVSKETQIVDLLAKLSSKKCGCVLVVDNKMCLEGIFTDGDLRRCIEADRFGFLQKPVNDFMTRMPKFISAEEYAYKSIAMMEEGRQVTVLPVVTDNKVVGLLRLHDVISAGLKN